MNYYNILNIPNDATLKEINTNFKNLSNRFHPDKNPNDKYSEEKMKEISEAYNTLSDYDKRKDYDQYINTQILYSKINHNKLIKPLDSIRNNPLFNFPLINNKFYSNQTSSTIVNGYV